MTCVVCGLKGSPLLRFYTTAAARCVHYDLQMYACHVFQFLVRSTATFIAYSINGEGAHLGESDGDLNNSLDEESYNPCHLVQHVGRRRGFLSPSHFPISYHVQTAFLRSCSHPSQPRCGLSPNDPYLPRSTRCQSQKNQGQQQTHDCPQMALHDALR